MKLEIHLNEERWYFNQKWIKSYFSFSYADYHNHKRPCFWKLLVLNEDHIQAENGFPPRPHKDMEIISIPLEWELYHEDSFENEETVKKWWVQTISAGSWVSHSEVNKHPDQELKVLHIWIESENHRGTPLYANKKYFKKDRINTWQILASWDVEDECNFIHQDAYISRIQLNTREAVPYIKRNKEHWVYFFVIEWGFKFEWNKVWQKDAMWLVNIDKEISILGNTGENDILAIEVPMTIKAEG
jgi:redox-sensitive bicupin YhaK (pirin superfamily)